MTDQERAVMQQALEALYEETAWFGPTPKGAATITALRAALAQEQANGSWHDGVLEGQLRERERWLAQQPEPVQEPAAWRSAEQYSPDVGSWFEYYDEFRSVSPTDGLTPLYTTPPHRPPLTDEEIVEAVRDADLDWQAGWTLDEHEPNRFTTLARAVERRVRGE